MTADQMLDRVRIAAVAHMHQPSVDHLHDDDRRQIIVDRTNALALEMMHQILDVLSADYFERQDLMMLIRHRLLPGKSIR